MINKMYEYFGVEPKYFAIKFEQNEYGHNKAEKLSKEDYELVSNSDLKSFYKELKEIKPDFTPDKAWKLEEMILRNYVNINYSVDTGDDNYYVPEKYCLQVEYMEDSYTYKAYGNTRLEALASLIPKIDWTEQEKEQIKAILEK